MNLLDEEIRVIQVSMAHIKRAISFAESSGEKLKLENKYKQLGEILDEKLNCCENYRG